jgi:hypothetical protein
LFGLLLDGRPEEP